MEVDLLRTFEVELRASAESIQACLLTMDEAEPAAREHAAHEAYRLTHSIKGAARAVGLTTIEEMSHGLEERLQVVVREKAALSTAETTAFLRVVDGFVAAFEAFLRGDDFDPRPYVELCVSLARPPVPAAAALPEPAVVPGSTGLLRAAEVATEATTAQSAPGTRRDDVLRIPAERVDELFRRVEEAFLIGSRMSSLVATLEDETLGSAERQRVAPELKRESSRLHQVLIHFHEVVRLMRMEQLDRLRVPVQRAVRDLSASLGKKVAFEIHGRREMVDASILDALQEPLLHLVRNAVDHGIETPAERLAAGKPPEGRVALSAETKSGALELALSDDGRGVPVERVRDEALKRGLVRAEDSLSWSDAEWLELVFRPGFSTAAEVSAISGRGMGLDIVRDRLRKIGGDVTMSSTAGRGTRFELRVPIGTLTARALLVRCGAHRVGLPIADVSGVFALKKTDGEEVGGQRLVRWNGLPLTLEPLGAWLGWDTGGRGEGHVVVVSTQKGHKAWLVDEVLGEIEQPAVPPPANVRALSYISGVIVLGDGDVVLLVDARELARSGASAAEAPRGSAEVASTELARERRCVLVVDDSPTVRALHRSILQTAGFEVLVADDGADALTTLEKRGADLVVTDIQMPRMDGLTLVSRIRERAAWRRIPIIVVSQYGRSEDLQKAAALGADRYIIKSAFKPEELVAMVQELVAW